MFSSVSKNLKVIDMAVKDNIGIKAIKLYRNFKIKNL